MNPRPATRTIGPRALLLALGALAAGCTGPSNPTDGGADGARDGGLDAGDVLAPDASLDGDGAATDATDAPTANAAPAHSSSIVLDPTGARLYVVNADSDSVSVIDTASRALLHEIPLGAHPPAVDPTTQRFDPAVGPRYLALAPRAGKLYVSAQRSGELVTVDLASNAVTQRVHVGSEPAGVVLSPDEAFAYVACTQEGYVAKVDTASDAVVGTAQTAWKPWALSFSSDGGSLYVTHLLGPGNTPAASRGPSVSVLDPGSMAVRASWDVPDTAPRGDKRLAHGEVRGFYDVAVRPGAGELWTAHLMLGTDTAQPDLDFESTVFPTLTALGESDGAMRTRMSTDVMALAGADGQFNDITSGPHAIAFTADGRYAFVVNTNSEDVLVVDATAHREPLSGGDLRHLPGHMPEGIALSPDGLHAYVDERNTGDVAVLSVSTSDGGSPQLAVDGAPIARLASDPMPAQLRLGQRIFYSANSDPTDGFPITQNRWVACASCHVEARSDAVIWRFEQGPRDTPSNAGGMRDTGFLFRTADRNTVRDYWRTIHTEQGGTFEPPDDPTISMWLDAVTAFVNLAIPAPVPPHTDPTLVARGSELFHRADVGCSGCHTGAAFTDSGEGNPTLDLAGPVVLHDVGTCATTGFPDVAHTDVDMHPRAACLFDTPSLRGVSDSAPYLHDGRAYTLRQVLDVTRGTMGNIEGLTDADLDAIAEYLKSL